jgi:tRNA(adenine34) deaminase
VSDAGDADTGRPPPVDDLDRQSPSGDDAASVDASDEAWMGLALEEARLAAEDGEVPVGAVIIDATGNVVGRGRNRREGERDPTAHAEMLALREAARALDAWRLIGTTVYVTLEPCPMCAGALVNARVARVVYGCRDPKAGAIESLYTVGVDGRLNHRFAVRGGVREAECAETLRAFFRARR